MKNFKPSMICIIMMLPFLVLGKTTGIDSKSELPPPVASITNNTGTTILTCTTTAISVTATGGTSYSWSGGSSTGTDVNSFTSPGTYTVTVTGSDASTATASVTITQDITPPTAGITNNSGTTILSCPSNTSISVTATPAGAESYVWDGGNNQYHDMNGLSSPGTYTVTVTALNGCTSTSSIVITQNGSIPTVTASSNSPVHLGENINLTASPDGATTYAWSGPCTFTSIIQSPIIMSSSIPASLGLYIVTVTFAGGCTVTASTYVELETIYTTTNTGTTELNCSNTSISATAIDTVTSGTYLWSGGTSPNTATNTFTAPGTYTVTVSSTNGSTQTTSVTITQNITPPTVGITNNMGATQLTCALTTIGVTATPAGANSYAWSGGTTPATANNSFTTPGTYTVTVTGTNGCTSTSSIIITQDISVPTASVSSNSPVCVGTTLNLVASSGGMSYLWSGPNQYATALQNATISAITIPSSGVYTVTVTSAGGCTSSAQIFISVNPLPIVVITNNTGTTDLNAVIPSINVTATGGDAYLWSGGNSLNTATNDFSAPGTFTVTVTSAFGCTNTESITITQVLDAPANPVVTAINSTGATLDWDGTKGVTTWDIRYKKLADANYTDIADVTIKPYTVTGLESGTTYIWNVRSVRNSMTSDWSLDNTFTTTVGISDYAIDGLSVYYFNNRINMVNNDNILVKEMIIFDMLGREVARYAINSTNQISIDVNVSPANYIVKVVLDERFGIYKLHMD